MNPWHGAYCARISGSNVAWTAGQGVSSLWTGSTIPANGTTYYGHFRIRSTTLGSIATFDPEWGGAIDTPLRAAAAQLSSDLGAGSA